MLVNFCCRIKENFRDFVLQLYETLLYKSNHGNLRMLCTNILCLQKNLLRLIYDDLTATRNSETTRRNKKIYFVSNFFDVLILTCNAQRSFQ